MEFFPSYAINNYNTTMSMGEQSLKSSGGRHGRPRDKDISGKAIPYDRNELLVLERDRYREAKAKRLGFAAHEKYKKSIAPLSIPEKHIEPKLTKAQYLKILNAKPIPIETTYGSNYGSGDTGPEGHGLYDPKLRLPRPTILPAPKGKTEQKREAKSFAREKKAEKKKKALAYEAYLKTHTVLSGKDYDDFPG
jgi:hypothetical protein